MKSAIASFLFIVFAFGCSGGSTEDDKDVPHDTIIKEITDFELKDGQICFSSSKFCEGNDVYLCNAAGDKKSFLKACSKGCSNGECCQPVCSGMECGDDGCGGVCGTCTGGKECLNAKCECVPDKKTDCQGNAMYKFDSCGNPGAKVADCLNGCENAQCKNCVPDCADKECGDNGCGTPCGTCTGGKECVNNKCQCKPENYKECSGNAVYWFDSCGNKGSKAQDCQYGCDKGVCKACEPDCSDKECGDDGCGTPCGTCKDGKECVSDKCACVADKYKDCYQDAVYWFDSCGVAGNKVQDCDYGCENAQCKNCQPDCSNKDCGDDGCGNECGICALDEKCVNFKCVKGLKCKEFWDCVAKCPQNDAACVADCQSQLSEQASTQVLSLVNCLDSNGCYDKSSDEEFYDCLDAFCLTEYFKCFSGDTHQTCLDLNSCLNGCPDDDPLTTEVKEDQECWNACFVNATFQANVDWDVFTKCLQAECPDPNWTDSCVSAAAAGKCVAGAEKCLPYGNTTCGGIVTCMNACPDNDQPCLQNCVNNGSLSAQALLFAVYDCLDIYCPPPNDTDECFAEAQQNQGKCKPQLDSCVNQ